jgi:hypothetical protein
MKKKKSPNDYSYTITYKIMMNPSGMWVFDPLDKKSIEFIPHSECMFVPANNVTQKPKRKRKK